MVPCLHVYPWTRSFSGQPEVFGGYRISAESAASEGNKRGPYDRSIAKASQHLCL